jgi:WD40 repeat protein
VRRGNCRRGEVKCWQTKQPADASEQRQKPTRLELVSGRGAGADVDEGRMKDAFSLLHTFKGHAKAVTSIRMHPISGLVITAGLDGVIKVLNLEAFSELFTYDAGAGITDLFSVQLGQKKFGILFTQTTNVVRLWNITSMCNFFATGGADIHHLQQFENLEAGVITYHKVCVYECVCVCMCIYVFRYVYISV